MPDDYTADIQTTGTVEVGGSTTGGIDHAGDRDWFAVELVAGQTYRINLKGSPTGSGTLRDPYLYGVYDATGTFLHGTTDDDGGRGLNSRVTFTPTETDTYYVAAGAHGSRTGTYTLSVRELAVDTDDFGVGVGTTGRVEVGGSTTGEIDYRGDRDWFAVELVAGRTYWIEQEGSRTGAGTLSDPTLYGVYDADGTFIHGATNNEGEGVNILVFTATETATYYVAAGAEGRNAGTYTLSVRDFTDDFTDDFADDTGTTGRVEVGSSTTGELDYGGDRDWFAVNLVAGQTYWIDLKGSWTEAGTLWDPYLYGVYDATGTFLLDTTDDNGGAGFDSRVTFTATDTDTYYVAAGAEDNHAGTYTLSVRELADDFADDTGTTGRVEVGSSTTGELETGFDYDWFAVELVAGQVYRINLKGSPTGSGTLDDPYLYGVYDAVGNFLPGTEDDDGGRGSNSRVTFTPTQTDTYYVEAGAYLEGGTYTLSVREFAVDADDFGVGVGTTGRVEVGGSTTGEIDYGGDRDWFAVELVAGRTYRIEQEGSWTGAGTLHFPTLYGVYDATGTFVPSRWGNEGDVGLLVFTATETDTYYVSAGSDDGREGTYTLSVREFDDFVADTGTTGRVEVGGSTTGEIDYRDDHDWFAVDLVAGQAYQIDLEGSPTGVGTLADPYLRGVYDATGTYILGATNDNSGEGGNSRVVFKATETDTYYVAAGAYGNHEGTYTLSLRELADDFTDDTGTTGRVEVGGSTTGELETGFDYDWFAVELVAGQAYQIDLEGSPTGAGTLADPYLHGMYDATGTYIHGTTNNNNGEGGNSRVVFKATETDTYYVAATGAFGNHAGTYTLSVRELADDFTDDTGTTGGAEVGGSTTGEIDYWGDRDWFAVELAAGQTYQIDLEGSPAGAEALADPYLRGVYDATGTIILDTTNDDGGTGFNSRVTFTATETDTYYVAAGAYGSHEGTYTLSVEEVM